MHLSDVIGELQIYITEIENKFRASPLTFMHRASSMLGQAFHNFPENAFYIFYQQLCFIIGYRLTVHH